MRESKSKSRKQNAKSTPRADTGGSTQPAVLAVAQDEVPARDAFLEEAKREPKRKLLSDHIETIKLLRNEKRFTFRAIADWLGERGFVTDHSAVYRAYLADIPEEQRDPREDWSEVDMPD